MTTAIIFILVLAVLIFVHELGHFIAARSAGIRVDAFKLGFGPKIFAWKRGETEYGVNLIPFGGYVKIHGENPDEEAVSGADSARSFVNKPRWKQVIVLVAGVFFNFLFAWLLYTCGFMYGVTATSDGFLKYADQFSNERVMITYITDGSPAHKAGLVIGDTIANLNTSGVPVFDQTKTDVSNSLQIPDVESIQQMINDSKGKPIAFSIKRNNEIKNIEIAPILGLVPDKYAVGIAMQKVGDLKLSVLSSVWEGLRYTLIMIKETAIGLYSFIANIFQGTANFADVAGPIGIAGIVGSAAHLGFTYLLMITALISINLGVINLIPFPALDGGRTLFVLIEGIIRRRISMKFTNIVNTVGFALLMLLMIVVTYKDVVKLFK